jgi:hypothetical protein
MAATAIHGLRGQSSTVPGRELLPGFPRASGWCTAFMDRIVMGQQNCDSPLYPNQLIDLNK